MLVALTKALVCRDYARAEVTTAAVVHLGTTYAAKMTKDGKICVCVEVSVETNALRQRHDGSDPTTGASGNGAPLAVNAFYSLFGSKNVAELRLIGLSGTGYAHIHFYYEK